ncbi:ethylmalonyl-CoA decarboxylase [Bufo gargarizans]|uniref:ethylmalonyl-CoA decarboxylase n=1 Tax=Bufo gargarizans TaxID=30331 RepID=UPI001CF1732E|nr:ethylmalonyl-CoA decarboxylase [Bufo gargarizans]XP_044146149.1 ethylmalonyl-CoA decarboxylase [Bufo gargarizans]XP_044146150.1 ethylmalonyl-CoA decarboxylase [Bufo gargarizans]
MALTILKCVPKNATARWCLYRRLYNSSHGFNETEAKKKLAQWSGGSINLCKGENGIAELCINHPSRKNAISGSMMLELEERVSDLENWKEGKGLIVYGAEHTFCSGGDLHSVKALSSPEDGLMMCMFMQNTLTRLQRLPLISVALVQGKALGGGSELCTACDFRLMTEESEIRFVHKHMAIVPGWGGASRLIQLVGSRQALKLLSSALAIHPEYALRIGLTDDILSSAADRALEEAKTWLTPYTKGPADTTRAIKKIVAFGREHLFEDTLRKEKDIFGTVWGSPAHLQALSKAMKPN